MERESERKTVGEREREEGRKVKEKVDKESIRRNVKES